MGGMLSRQCVCESVEGVKVLPIEHLHRLTIPHTILSCHPTISLPRPCRHHRYHRYHHHHTATATTATTTIIATPRHATRTTRCTRT
jgi:hypothetical protein